MTRLLKSLTAISNVLVVGVDFSEPSRHALHEAIRIARDAGARLIIAHFIYDEEMAHMKRWKGLKDSDIVAGRRSHLEAWLSESDVSGVKMDLRIEIGHPFAGLTKTVEIQRAKLLVLGAQGENHKRHGDAVGSVAKSCLRHPLADLLLIRKAHSGPFQSVLAAIDFSNDSKHAVHRSAEIARSDGSDLQVVHVFAPVWNYYGPSEGLEDCVEAHVFSMRKQLIDFVYSELQEVKTLPVRFAVRKSFSAYHGILEYAKETRADLIVVGRIGLGAQQLVSPGKTAERVIEKSECSVLAVFCPSKKNDS